MTHHFLTNSIIYYYHYSSIFDWLCCYLSIIVRLFWYRPFIMKHGWKNLIFLEFRTIIIHHHMMITYDKLLWWNSLLYSLGIIITHNHCFLVFRSFFAHSQPVPASKPCVSPGCDGSGPIQSAAQKAAEAAEEQGQDN